MSTEASDQRGQAWAPANHADAVTPSDTAVLIFKTRGLFVGGAGDVVVTMADGRDATFTGVVAGTILPIAVTKVKSTGTTATNIVALA